LKEFREFRYFAFEEFVKVLSQINCHGVFNNFNLNYLNVPLQGSLEDSYLQILMVQLYIKEHEKDVMWRSLASSNKQVTD
jgi:hypothetical protein